MSWFDSVRTAWDALAANKLRSALTMLGMVIGVSAVAAIISIGRGASDSVQQQLNSLGTDMFQLSIGFRPPPDGGPIRFEPGMEPWRLSFSEEDLAKLRRNLPDAQYVVTTMNTGAEIKVNGQSQWLSVMGVYPEHMEMMGLAIKKGRFFTAEEYEENARVAVVHEQTVQNVFPAEEDPIGKTITVQNFPFTIIGIIDKNSGAAGRFFSPGDGAVVPLSTLKKYTPWDFPIQQILVKVRPKSDLDKTAQLGKEFLETIHPGMFVDYFSPQQIQNAAGNVTDTVSRFAAAIAAISLLVGGVGIMNIMLVSVAERTREIGLRKALGASDEAILLQFLVEALVTGMTGGGLGLLVAMAPIHVARKWLQISISLAPDTVALAVGFAGIIGLIFGVYPAFKAARLDPIEALRQE